MNKLSSENFKNVLIIALGIAIPISNALTNILLAGTVLWVLLNVTYCEFDDLIAQPVVVASISLFTLIIIGLTYTSVSWLEGISVLKKYRELLYIPLFILIFKEKISRDLGLNAFITTTVILLSLSYIAFYFNTKNEYDPIFFKNYITQGILIALVAYFLALQAVLEKKWRFPRLFVLFLASYYITFMLPGRTGFLVLFSLAWLFLYQHYRWRGVFIGGLSLLLISMLILANSELLGTRMTEMVTYLANPPPSRSEGSTALRYEFVKYSGALIAESPIFGHGTGSFAHEYQQFVKNLGIHATTNPHSEYLMFAVQFGLIGLLLLFYLFYQLWRGSEQLSQVAGQMLQGLIVTMGIGCLFNSLLLDASEAHLFAYLTGLFLAESID